MALLKVSELVMRFGDRLIQEQVSFKVEKGSIFAIMGGSGCGKSTLLKHLVGLLAPASGSVTYGDVDFWTSDDAARDLLRAQFGMLFQSAALWSSMTVLENICLPLRQRNSTLKRVKQEQERGAGVGRNA
jgi:phospholipid/cholesterol/gamma-HCH transport system ATP-binding protein